MSLLSDAFSQGYADALEKLAGQKARMVARAAAAAGDMGKATRIMTAPGVVPPTSSGVPFKNLGAGGEGLAQLAVAPKYGPNPVVKKTFNPAAQMFSPKLIQRKEELAPQLNQNPLFAKMLGAEKTKAGVPVHYMEHVQGSKMPERMDQGYKEGPQEYRDTYEKTKRQAQKGMSKTPYRLEDVRGDNMVNTTQGPKVIDYMPIKRHEQAGIRLREQNNVPEHMLVTTNAGDKLFPNFGKANAGAKETPERILARAHGNPQLPISPMPKPAPAPMQPMPQAMPQALPQAMPQNNKATAVVNPKPTVVARRPGAPVPT